MSESKQVLNLKYIEGLSQILGEGFRAVGKPLNPYISAIAKNMFLTNKSVASRSVILATIKIEIIAD